MHTRRVGGLAAGILLSATVVSGIARAQFAGENVNMVSGVEWPGGDPFLQRQNEPTMAVSSVNPQHLMAGANDYRSVDVRVPDEHFAKMKSTPDAWLGVFKSLDGGQTWKSTLLPGYRGDPSDAGRASPLRGTLQAPGATPGAFDTLELPACADPVMRAGTDGMFYYAGINFSRDKRASRVFVARFLDLNNRENGDAAKAAPTDPIRYLDTVVVSANLPLKPNVFVDKPWIAVDVPRAGAQTCTVAAQQADGTTVVRSFKGGMVYAAWAEFQQPDETRSDVMFTWSADCGQTWVTPYKISSNNSVLSQGVGIAIEPITGRVYVAWRRAKTPLAPKQSDAILVTRSEGRKRHFSHARVVASLAANPFDQGTSYGSFRSNAFPSLAISSDGASSWAHVAWTDRQPSGDARVVMSTARVHPRPTGDDDDDDPEDSDDETRLPWSKPALVDTQPVGDDANHLFGRGHQFMPALAAGQGRLVLTYYDSRLDHTRRYYTPRTPVTSAAGVPEFPGGKFYDEELAPIGDYFQQLEADWRAGGPVPGPVFNPWLADSFGDVDPATGKPSPATLTSWVKVRHGVEVRAAMADAGPSPVFQAVTLSRYPFGASGEGNPPNEALTAPRFDSAGAPATPTGNNAEVLSVVDGNGRLQLLSQFQMNPPNFPIFKNGSVAFIGDYIDVAGPMFTLSNGAWAFYTARSATPVFHAVWTSNQDVRTPPIDLDTGLPAWDRYVPPGQGGILSKYDGQSLTQPCDPTAPAFAGSRDQNVYTSRITDGLSVSSPQNAKPLGEYDANGQLQPVPRSFVIAATNARPGPMTVRFAAALPTGATGVDLSWIAFGAGAPETSLPDIVVPALSSVSRTLFVKLNGSTNPGATVLVTVTQTSDCTGAGCASATLTLNPPVALASLLQPDGAKTGLPDVGVAEQQQAISFDHLLSDPNWSNPNWSNSNPNPNWSNPNWSNPNWSNPNWSNPNWSNPNWSNLGFTNPNWSNPNWSNPNWSNPNWSNPNWSNPNWSNPNWSNPNWSNPNWSNPNWSKASIADLNASIQNTGNTTTAFTVKLVKSDPSYVAPGPIQLLITKIYETPTLDGCFVRPKPNFQLAVNVPDVSGALVPANAEVSSEPRNGDATNATVVLAPGEKALVTIRAQLTLPEMAEVGKQIAPAAVPQTFVPNGTTYAQARGTPGSPIAIRGATASSTDLATTAPGAQAFRATVRGSGGTPTGAVTFVRTSGGTSRSAALVALVGGVADVSIDPALGGGERLVAYYGGDATYAPSSSAPFLSGKIATITNVVLASTSLTINSGVPGGYTATLTNFTASTLSQIIVQTWIEQGSARRASGGAKTFTCGPAIGDLPPGSCTFGFGLDANNTQSAGTGKLAAGAANVVFELKRFDPATNQETILDTATVPITLTSWMTRAPMVQDRAGHATAAIGTDVYAVGGISIQGGAQQYLADVGRYATATGTWTAVSPLPMALANAAAATAGGRIFLFGGDQSGDPVARVLVYDPAADTWTQVATLPYAVVLARAVTLPNGRIYVIGGDSQTAANPTVWGRRLLEFDPASGAVVEKALMNDARFQFAAAAANGKIYVFGGRSPASTDVSTIEAYDPATDSWTLISGAGGAGQTTAAVTMPEGTRETVTIAGGYVPAGTSGSTLVRYDPAANSFTLLEPMANPVVGGVAWSWQLPGVAIVGTTIYATGGFLSNGTTTSRVDEYFVP